MVNYERGGKYSVRRPLIQVSAYKVGEVRWFIGSFLFLGGYEDATKSMYKSWLEKK